MWLSQSDASETLVPSHVAPGEHTGDFRTGLRRAMGLPLSLLPHIRLSKRAKPDAGLEMITF